MQPGRQKSFPYGASNNIGFVLEPAVEQTFSLLYGQRPYCDLADELICHFPNELIDISGSPQNSLEGYLILCDAREHSLADVTVRVLGQVKYVSLYDATIFVAGFLQPLQREHSLCSDFRRLVQETLHHRFRYLVAQRVFDECILAHEIQQHIEKVTYTKSDRLVLGIVMSQKKIEEEPQEWTHLFAVAILSGLRLKVNGESRCEFQCVLDVGIPVAHRQRDHQARDERLPERVEVYLQTNLVSRGWSKYFFIQTLLLTRS